MTQESELPKNFDPSLIEKKWYRTWEEENCFRPVPSKINKVFSIIMPPPNVTGKLHMGHALDLTTQDILTRFKRMKGFETLWLPGTDHAGIATQAKVEKLIYEEEKKTRYDLGRDEFLKRIWAFKEEYGNTIVDQQKNLGASCDWDYSTFTMDKIPHLAVRTFFKSLFDEGLIYQADYIVNWDPVLQSAISDAEVDHQEIKGNFYHLKYKIKDSDDFLEIATTRPETIFADTAVAVHPEDERFKHLIGKNAIVPLCQREVKIIADEYVDIEKGTGALKVTPAHDFNDFEIGKRHGLEKINILNKDGSFNETASLIGGLKVQQARKKTVELLKEEESLIEVKPHKHQVGHGQRSGTVIEPLISKQWFLNVEGMAENAVHSVENEEMKFFPKGWENTYFAWLREPNHWCISRQLWWGHQIPIFYCDDCDHKWSSIEDPTSCEKCQSKSFHQDPDVLDTWFSSGLWPLSTLGWPDQEKMIEKKFETFFPNTTLITGHDIIFFWVARMMMSSLKINDQAPFRDVYIHPIVRDKQGRKMSKSLGNGIDPNDVTQEFGADSVRFTLALGCGYNRDINLDPDKFGINRNFMNKIWNAFRFIHPFLENVSSELIDKSKWHLHDKWILSELNNVAKKVNESIEVYRFDEASIALYQFVYDKFCSWYIELSKNILYGDNEEAKLIRASQLKFCFEKIVTLLHPFCPFLTEEIWSLLGNENRLINGNYIEPNIELESQEIATQMNNFIDVISGIRNIRASVNLKPKEKVEVKIYTDHENLAKFIYEHRTYLSDLANVTMGTIEDKTKDRPTKSASFVNTMVEIFIPLDGVIDLDVQIKRLEKERDKTSQEMSRLEKKLGNEKFVSNAPKEVIDEVKEKAALFKEKLQSLEKNIQGFKS